MKFNAVLTKKQAEEMLDYLGDVFTEVRLLDIEAIRRLEKEKNSLSLKAFRERCQKTRLEYVDSRVYQKISRYVEIDGQPYVVEMLNVLDDTPDDSENAREQLVAKVRGYNEELYLDALTGAYNRRYYEDRIRKVRSHAGVAMIDLDDFKLYNDACGHNAGDLVLNTVVSIIRKCIRRTDILIRYGGDEFLLIIPDVEEAIFSKKLKQIRDMVYKAEVPGYAKLRLSVSIGGVLADNETIESAVGRADGLMYQAKNRKNMSVTEGSGIDSAEVKEQQQILIVDDSHMNREILTVILEEEYRILEATNGEECIDLLKLYGTGISLILLDINMPVMTGLEATKVINEDKLAGFVIILTAYRDKEITDQAVNTDVMGYIVKPVDEDTLIPSVKIAIHNYNQREIMAKEFHKTQEALDDRKYLDRAKGLVMERKKMSEKEAYTYIRSLSMDKGISMTELSKMLLKAYES